MILKIISKPLLFSIHVVLAVVSIASFFGCNENYGVKINDKAPIISGFDIYGTYISLSQFKGNVVILYFWTDSCCGEKLKQLEPYYKQYQYRGLTILAVNEKNTREAVESYAKANSLTFSLYTDEMGMMAKEYGVFGFPTFFIIDRNGVIKKKISGDINVEQLEGIVVQFL
jgi:peroxiredoxin